MEISSLKSDYAFRRLRKGRAGHAKQLSIRWLADQKGSVRVGIIVNKKVGKAVIRNKVRRRFHEAFKHLLKEEVLIPQAKFKHDPSFSLVIIARPEAATADYWELKRSLKKAIKQGKLFL